jgi:hypothetical protein
MNSIHGSLLGLTVNPSLFSKKMDPRVKPAGDDLSLIGRARSIIAGAVQVFRREFRRCSIPLSLRGTVFQFTMPP